MNRHVIHMKRQVLLFWKKNIIIDRISSATIFLDTFEVLRHPVSLYIFIIIIIINIIIIIIIILFFIFFYKR